jgi:hypothetical protein
MGNRIGIQGCKYLSASKWPLLSAINLGITFCIQMAIKFMIKLASIYSEAIGLTSQKYNYRRTSE